MSVSLACLTAALTRLRAQSRDNNFKIFRDSLRTVSPPSIPFLGLYLSDLTFIEEGNSNYLDENGSTQHVVWRGVRQP